MKPHQKIAFAMTAPSALRAFMGDHIRVLAKQYEVTVYCNFSADSCRNLLDESVQLVHIPFERKIAPFQDMACFFLLLTALWRGKFDSVHTVMPKTGLLGMLAGWIVRTPVRIHLFTGQVWVTKRGMSRAILKTLDKLMAWCATTLYIDSPSQRDFLIQEGIIRSGRVLGDGSVNGVDSNRFKPDVESRNLVRRLHQIPLNAVVFGFLGRLNRDKGILDLMEAFSVSAVSTRAFVLLVGPDEGGMEDLVRKKYSHLGRQIRFVGFTSEPEKIIPAFDVFCIPSYREGFGSSVIEAAACGVPALASRIYGLTDAVVENVTGFMHEPGNTREISEGLNRYADNAVLRNQFGKAARERAVKQFSTARLTSEMAVEYTELLQRVKGRDQRLEKMGDDNT